MFENVNSSIEHFFERRTAEKSVEKSLTVSCIVG